MYNDYALVTREGDIQKSHNPLIVASAKTPPSDSLVSLTEWGIVQKQKQKDKNNLTSPLTSQSLNPSKTSTTSALQATTYSSDYSPQQYHPHPSKPNPQSHSNPA